MQDLEDRGLSLFQCKSEEQKYYDYEEFKADKF